MRARNVLKGKQRDVFKRLRLQLGALLKEIYLIKGRRALRKLIEVVNLLIRKSHKTLMNALLFVPLEA